jgi:shikimate dehydrogenase
VRAAVLGSPIAHSLSPALHRAAYGALGLDWTYDALEVTADALPRFLDGLDGGWAGLSLTMPLKEAALAVATAASPAAAAVGAANTLVRRPDGTWFADNTDIPGMVRVLRDAGVAAAPTMTVLGGGGTARAALAAAAQLGSRSVTVVARRASAYDELVPVAAAVGLELTCVDWNAVTVFETDTVISTVPKGAADDLAMAVRWRPGTMLFDAIYDPWPTPLAAAAEANGLPVASGLDLLLAQALGQFEQFTGVAPAPETAMHDALFAAAALRWSAPPSD